MHFMVRYNRNLKAKNQGRDFKESELVMRTGEPSRHVYILLSDQVRLLTRADGKTALPSRLLGPGSVFGLVALVRGKARLATTTAAGE
jgi:CRP-like cAMP-binding protein